MLKQLTQKPLLIALLAATAGFASNVSAMEDIKVDPAMKAHIPYVIDARGVVAPFRRPAATSRRAPSAPPALRHAKPRP